MNTPNTDPSVEQLVAFALGELDSSQAAALDASLTRTPEARRLLEQFRALVRTLRTDDSVSPPAALVRTAQGLMGAASSAAAPAPRPALREVVAALVFDSLGKVAIAGFRGTVADRQLAYSSEVADIDLQVSSPDPSRREYRGQVTPFADSAAVEVTLARPGEPDAVSSSPVDSTGMFSLESAPGTFDLRVRVGDSVVLLPTLSVE